MTGYGASDIGLEPLKDCDFSFIKDLVFRVHRKMETLVLSAMSDTCSCHKAIIQILFMASRAIPIIAFHGVELYTCVTYASMRCIRS